MDTPRRRWVLLTALLGAALVLAERSLLLASSGHLLFDVNQAEYGFLGAIIPWLSHTPGQLLGDPAARRLFFHDCLGVGNQVHGSLGLAGLATLWGAQLSGAALSTALIRTLALGQSTLALLLWCRGLGAATRSRAVVGGFCLLWMLSPPVHTKITMLWWGTHDTVLLLSSVWVAVLLPWLARPAAGLRAVTRAAALGALGGLLLLGNYALLMPTLGGALFFIAAHALRGRLATAAACAGAFFAAQQASLRLLLRSGFFDGLGYPRAPSGRHFLGLSGKHGQPFLHAAGDWRDPDRWVAEVWPIAVRQSPLPAYGDHAVLAESIVRTGALAVGLGLLALWLRRRRSSGGAGAWLGLYLPLAALGIGALGLGFTPDLGGRPGPQPRYFAHLYPVAMAVLAIACLQPGRLRWARAALLLWPLWLGGFDHARLIDLAVARDRWSTQRLELAPLYFRARPERLPPPGREPMPGASADFLDGYAIVERAQFRRYWRWLEPAQVADADVLQQRLGAALADEGQPEDYWRGVGAGLRVLVPPERAALIARLPTPPKAKGWIKEGYAVGNAAAGR